MKKILLITALFLLFCGSVYADSLFLYTTKMGNQTTTFGHINGKSVYENSFSYNHGRETYTVGHIGNTEYNLYDYQLGRSQKLTLGNINPGYNSYDCDDIGCRNNRYYDDCE